MQIKQVVFDLGNVLVRFAPQEFVAAEIPDPQAANAILRTIFESDIWYRLDEGTLEEPQAIEEACRYIPQYRAQLEHLFTVWDQYLTPIPEMEPLLRTLREKGYRLYLLSNASSRFYRYRERIPALQLLDGAVISSDCRVAKPHRAIFDQLCQNYGLRAEECLFIDDLPQNVAGAQAAGFFAIRCTGFEPLCADLRRLGLL